MPLPIGKNDHKRHIPILLLLSPHLPQIYHVYPRHVANPVPHRFDRQLDVVVELEQLQLVPKTTVEAGGLSIFAIDVV